MKIVSTRILLGICTLTTTFAAQVQAAPPRADLKVVAQPAVAVRVYDSAQYTFQVSNIGRADAAASSLRIVLPKTANSPTAYLMGSISQLDSRCSLANLVLTCGLGTMAKNASTVLSFRFAVAHAEKPLSFDASVSTSSTEASLANNTAKLSPNLTYASAPMVAGMLNNKHCTGSNSLSSFQECLYAPSSISQHDVEMLSNGDLLTEDPNVTGIWRQATSSDLYFEYSEAGEVIARFQGKAISDKCFEGVTRFPLSPNYVSPYRVCMP